MRLNLLLTKALVLPILIAMQRSIMPMGYSLERKRQLLEARLLQERAEELARASFIGRMRIRWQIRAAVAQKLKDDKATVIKRALSGWGHIH